MSTSKKPLVITGVAALILGVTIGAAANGGGDEPAQTASPAVETVTVTEEAEPVTVTEEVQVEVETTPQACLDALDGGDAVILIGAEGMSLAGDSMAAAGLAFDGVINGDITMVEQATADMEVVNSSLGLLNDELDVAIADYQADSAACRDSAGSGA